MIYSTLKEVYDVDTFERKKKKKKCIDDYSDNGDDVIKEKDGKERKNKDLYLQAVPTQCSTAPSRKQNMSNVRPFLDDELEHYFNFNDYQNVIPKPLAVNEPVVVAGAAAPVVVAPVVQPAAVTPVAVSPVPAAPSAQSKKDAYYKNLINIGLFVFIGILIIFLCDQITEIAINIGMKRTVTILEPYLARLEKLSEKS